MTLYLDQSSYQSSNTSTNQFKIFYLVEIIFVFKILHMFNVFWRRLARKKKKTTVYCISFKDHRGNCLPPNCGTYPACMSTLYLRLISYYVKGQSKIRINANRKITWATTEISVKQTFCRTLGLPKGKRESICSAFGLRT